MQSWYSPGAASVNAGDRLPSYCSWPVGSICRVERYMGIPYTSRSTDGTIQPCVSIRNVRAGVRVGKIKNDHPLTSAERLCQQCDQHRTELKVEEIRKTRADRCLLQQGQCGR
jgi:hypothetical protein